MPELPEVETIRRSLAFLCGARIRHVDMRREDVVRSKDYDFKELYGQKIEDIGRRGKFLILKLEKDLHIILHLGMSGRFFVVEEEILIDQPHIHCIIYLDNAYKLVYQDPRRFGGIWLVKDRESFFSCMGKEPLHDDFNCAYLSEIAKRHKTAIKSLLLQQKVVAGIGNIYADEALFASGIRPDRKACSLTHDEVEALCKAIKEVLLRSIEAKGTTFRDYRDGYGRKGNFQNFLAVYGREGEACPRCGAKISREKIGGRSSYFCPECQK
ncbi:DNA-(apurinic or apyrimidinic site) lyase [Thermosyntropha lipolytica DSM 11003]|uniref:Formamidopyrimidine-DNA glycosylase n=1 Tax=Thermosyntropha lipolytica DSM 11003 TaxID=1123382 RepID=A0A1M5MZW7_9FIRM|nr:bifunctional DNA-formamidopyrimidine glycosylase/DNA-(apurinic or apyrimidinic site) lyase [Thermosyntropha lipolytica]SHG82777.1 DNA-(apurinic or apyrimidinic site) lyase [Thermosyntropha lipolytica DSM 11003]